MNEREARDGALEAIVDKAILDAPYIVVMLTMRALADAVLSDEARASVRGLTVNEVLLTALGATTRKTIEFLEKEEMKEAMSQDLTPGELDQARERMAEALSKAARNA